MQHEDFMRIAIEKAREGIQHGQTPFGACIVKDGQVISCEHNGVWETTDITAHAEIRAIRAACNTLGTVDLSGCVIYSTCEPCPMCFSACHWARLNAIFFGAQIEDARSAGFNELSIHDDVLKKLGKSTIRLDKGLLREQNTALFQEWISKPDHRVY